MHTLLNNYWKSILVTLLLFYLSFARPASLPQISVFNLTDKAAHYLIYVACGLMLIYDFIKANGKDFSPIKFYLVCVFGPIILGGLIEIAQETFFKPRSAEWLDWLCDIVGILTAWLIFIFFKTKTNIINKL
ncbi:MAG: VanZ family protein [Paludibacter sp.]|nr:VanZ family protein [Paludibacter sp.]